MALPYSPRTTFDVTVDLASSDIRTYSGATYAGKHVRVIPKNFLDTGRGFVFNGPASVTIIGGYFQPTAASLNPSGTKGPAVFSFVGVGDVYLEGVALDAINLASEESDGIHIAPGTALTNLTAQNCHFTNIRGLAGDVATQAEFVQIGSANTGKAGDIRLHNCSFGGEFIGIFLDPQSGGGLTSLTMSRVNAYRTAQQAGSFPLLTLTTSSGNWDARGYPASFTDVFLDGGQGQGLAQTLQPANTAGTAGFPVKYQATFTTDATGVHATYPGLNDVGKVVSGRIDQGAPAGGSYAPLDKIGVNYVQGTEIVTETGTGDPWASVTGGNLLLPQNWIPEGAGTVAINATTGQVSITASGTRTAAGQMVPTEIGARYRFSYHIVTTQSIASPVGTAQGLSDLYAEFLRSPAPGDIATEFVATTNSTYVAFSRTTTGTPRAASAILEKVPASPTLARRLNGTSQHFQIDAAASGLRTANYNWFIGGWMRWTYMPAVTAYILDFGDGVSTGGGGRNRIVWDAAQSKLLCSSALPNGTGYRECAYVAPLQRDAWYHIGMLCFPDGDVQLYFNGMAVGSRAGATVTPFLEDVCKKLTFGARQGAAVTDYNPARYADWVWCSNTVPTAPQIAALAANNRPDEIDGFTPTHWWAFNQTSTTEPSLTAAATLTATGAPTTVIGPMEAVATPPAEIPRPLDLIII